jgi:hypothetical protein
MNSKNAIPNDMQAAIENFDKESEEVVNSFARSFEEEPAPAMIYHYTNDAGLRGIIDTGKLWLTDIFNLNDPSELRYGLKPAIAAPTEG